jgi:predicted RNase H-like HicB family nuclease
MTSRRFKVLLEWDAEDSVWVTYVPALNHLSTFGETREKALDQTREAILGYIEAAAIEGISVPDADPALELTEVEVVTV